MKEEKIYTFSVLDDGFLEDIGIYARNLDDAFFKLSVIEKAKDICYIPEMYRGFYYRRD